MAFRTVEPSAMIFRLFSVSALLALVLTACGAAPDESESIPHPDVTALEPLIQDQIATNQRPWKLSPQPVTRTRKPLRPHTATWA